MINFYLKVIRTPKFNQLLNYRLFESIDLDRDNCISQEELKELIVKINLGKIPWDEDEIVRKIMEELDVNRDQVINEEEFTSGLLKWLNTQAPNSTESEDDLYQVSTNKM